MKPDHECSAPGSSSASTASARFDALLRLARRLSGLSICGVATFAGGDEPIQLEPAPPSSIEEALSPLIAHARISQSPLLIQETTPCPEPLICFAGYPLRADTGECLGVLYLAGTTPRSIDADLQLSLQDIADSVAQIIIQAQAKTEETLLALAIQGSGTGIWDRDLSTGRIHYSAAWKSMLGYAANEVSNRIEDAFARIHPDELEQVTQSMQAHISGQTEQYQVEHRLRCQDGTYKWVNSRGKVVSRDAAGNALRMLGITTDISKVRSLSERLQHNIELITQLTDQVPGVVFQFCSQADGTGHFTYLSAGVRDLFEVTPEQLQQNPTLLDSCVHPDDLEVFNQSRAHALSEACIWHIEYRVQLPRQGLRWHLGEARPQCKADGSIIWHGMVTDITERKHVERELHEFASMDALTQLANRRVFMAYLKTEQARIQRRDVSVSSLLMCDLDHFKLVNDKWGHGIGDRALRHFSDILRAQLRTSDLAGRIGGEEFAVLLSGAGSFPARDFACRVQHALASQPLRVDNQEIHLTLSIGITQLAQQDPTPDNALSRADTALYRAKQNGRNRVEIT
ncbi:sensor domain-containing diguanylate cyclase [Phytopseudomonas punonensis]|uniref:PAS domain S-box-containing protein/diguanylate cyclase (GGDEF) domain-containing protein n=1 Tax=Phytopseudomonas punonensis TaxID=1220495 RepID=A0A1M7JQF2_9GAMM|nr:diguanylate cyclase [Pseudomonas punonensis]SHM54943.1 PAS domain S-box-containing protein/diguanylate cyclase (GGDEF) domain-containing protein [Pseudomonas punonensis]